MEVETQYSQLPEPNPENLHVKDYHANVDTSKPFRSVKEAVAIFGERLLLGEMYSSPKPASTTSSWKLSPPKYKDSELLGEMYSSPKPASTTSSWKLSPPKYKESEDISSCGDEENGDNKVVMDTLKKLEAELEETKVQLKLLKERESETEVAVASLNAELHKNMSKLAQAEAAAAAKASDVLHVASRPISSSPNNISTSMREEERNIREWIRMEDSISLAQILSIGAQKQGYNGGGKRERKAMKQKPIVPLVQDLFSWKKWSSTPFRNPLYSSPQLYN